MIFIDLILVTLWVLGLFAFAGGIAWLADQVASFHMAGMERVRRIQEKEREGAR
jgi:cytochrome c oxidase assembly factor CtaG